MRWLDTGVRAGEDKRLVTVVEPAHHVRRAAVRVAQLHDDADAPTVADVRALENEPIAKLRVHTLTVGREPGRVRCRAAGLVGTFAPVPAVQSSVGEGVERCRGMLAMPFWLICSSEVTS